MRIFKAIKCFYDENLVLFAALSLIEVVGLAIYGFCEHNFVLWDVFMQDGHGRFGMFLICIVLYIVVMAVLAYPLCDFYWWGNDKK